jgi:hypothetical protein
MPWRDADIFSSFPGIYLEPASCATHEDSQAHDEIGGGTWKKTMMHMSKAKEGDMHVFISFPKTGCCSNTLSRLQCAPSNVHEDTKPCEIHASPKMEMYPPVTLKALPLYFTVSLIPSPDCMDP